MLVIAKVNQELAENLPKEKMVLLLEAEDQMANILKIDLALEVVKTAPLDFQKVLENLTAKKEMEINAIATVS